MIDKAIYYPYIDVVNAQRDWFVKVLLYWDQIGSIIPHEFIDDKQKLSPYAIELIENDLLINVDPAKYANTVPNFSKPFINLIDNSQIVNNNFKITRENSMLIHIDKLLFDIWGPICDRGLAKEFYYPWFQVEKKTASQYMAYLASVLGRNSELQMTPVTDKVNNLSEFKYQNFHASENRLHDVRTDVLNNILPTPTKEISIKEIVEFKEEHGDLLTVFRRNIEKNIINISKTEDDYLMEREKLILIAELKDDINEISNLMKRKNWGKIMKEFLTAVNIGIPLGTILQQGVSGPEYLKIPGLILAIYSAYEGSKVQNEIFKAPLAYAVFAKKQFSG